MELSSLLHPYFFWKSHTYQPCGFLFGLLQLVYLHCSTWSICPPPSADTAIPPHSCLQTSYPPFPHFISPSFVPSPSPNVSGCFSIPCASSSPHDLLRVLQWNTRGFLPRSTKLVCFILSHHVDLICIQESNLNSCSSFWMPAFSALQSDRTHY